MLATADTWLQLFMVLMPKHQNAKSQLELHLPFSPEAWFSLLGFKRDALVDVAAMATCPPQHDICTCYMQTDGNPSSARLSPLS